MGNTRSLKQRSLIYLVAAGLSLPAFAAQDTAGESRAKPLLSQATYRGLRPGRFMTKWVVLGPVPVSADESARKEDAEQKKAFDTDPFSVQRFRAKVRIGPEQYEWRPLTSPDGTINLVEALGQETHAVAYAWARINVAQDKRALLGIGSDDAVKVWLNGELVHENWVQRACVQDSDLVPVTFRKGRNHLVLKVQNSSGEWAFSCRVLGQKALAEKLISSVRSGHLDPVTLLLDSGVDVNATVGPGLTALHMARITGRADAEELLLEQGADESIEMPAREKIIDWALGRVIKPKYPGVALLVARDGEVLYQNGYGHANIEHAVKVAPETKFRIGSISKQFTAAAILKLQEAGELSVEDKLSKFLPDYPRGDEVTLHHLLTHASGIHSYTSKSDFMKTVTVETTPEELVNSFKDDEFDLDPGENQSYCNSGYFLLGYIVEKVTGKSLGDYLQETFFGPLDMDDTGIHHWSLILEHEATGYSYGGGQVKKALDWDMSRAGGAGALYSTVGDLYRWNEALFNGKVLKESTRKAAFTPATLKSGEMAKGPGGGYGYGWGIGTLRGLDLISHGGGLDGFSSYLMRLPGEQLTVAVLANSLPAVPGLSTAGFAHHIAEIYLFDEMEQQRSFAVDTTVDPKVYDDYVGRYDYGNSLVLTVTKEEDRLFAQLTGQGKAEIFPRSQGEFFWKEVDAQVTFVRNEEGAVTGAVHKQGGQTLDAPKLKDEPVAQIDPAVYETYVGRYELENVGMLEVTRQGGHLFAQLTGQPRFEIFPRSETEFFLKVVQASITFTKDEHGAVTSLTLRQAGKTLIGKKVK